MWLPRTHTALSEIQDHIDLTNAAGSPIEAYLAQYLLITLCAEMQQEVVRLVSAAGARAGDVEVAAFVEQSCGRVFRSVGKDEIARIVGMFGSHVKDQLNASLDPRKVTVYSNAVAARHDVAHKSGAIVSFREVKAAIEAAELILAAVEIVLCIRSTP